MFLVSSSEGTLKNTHHRICNRGGLELLVNSAANGHYRPESLGVILRGGLELEGSAANVGVSVFKEE